MILPVAKLGFQRVDNPVEIFTERHLLLFTEAVENTA
jgi:hypothetical protein